jgi:Ca-activated chloride channel family protein
MQDPIDVRYAVNHQYLKSNSPGTVFMAIEIHSLNKSEDSSKTSSLSLVVDCSSSMRGEKFKQAKESALHLFGLLRDDDYLSIISFHKSAKVSLPSSKKSESESAENIIRNLQLGIGTNIYEGLAFAKKEISKQTIESDSKNSITKRIVLLTDGQASYGNMEEKDFVSLSKKIREDDTTISTIGIGDDYDQQLLQAIAETGGGVPYHVKEIYDLQRIFDKQADELSSTVLISPAFTITMMPGAKIQEVYTVTPTLRRQNLDKSNNNRYVARLKDIIIGQRQTLSLRVDLPERAPGRYRLARIELNDLVKNIEVEYTDNHLLYSKETDPYPRMILTCSEATSLVNKGVQAGDQETIRKAETLMYDLSQDKDFEEVMTKRPLIKKMAATIRRVIERISQGPLTESEKRQAIDDTTILFK